MKRRDLLFGLSGSALAIAAAGHQGASRSTAEEKPKDAVRIPLERVYTTSAQKNLTRPEFVRDEKADKLYERVRKEVAKTGLTNLFLAGADDLRAALMATDLAFSAAYPGDKPVQEVGSTPAKQYWLVVYLGLSGSEPPRWYLNSVRVQSELIRFHYVNGEREERTADECVYLYWVPLGKLKAGTYLLEIFDDDTSMSMLGRRVTVSA
jgi:hypothetical protein